MDYPAGNNHGSIANIGGQWYVFYHRMTNNTIMSRRACVEKIEILEDGTIPPVEMTSLGFEEALNPYAVTPAELACVLKGGCFVAEKDIFTRVITQITEGAVIGYKYFDFGNDFTSDPMTFSMNVLGMGINTRVNVMLDDPDKGEEIGYIDIGTHDGAYKGKVKNVTGRHAVYFVYTLKDTAYDWMKGYFTNKLLFEFREFVFLK